MSFDAILRIQQAQSLVESFEYDMKDLESDLQQARDHLAEVIKDCPHPDEYMDDAGMFYNYCRLCHRTDV